MNLDKLKEEIVRDIDILGEYENKRILPSTLSQLGFNTNICNFPKHDYVKIFIFKGFLSKSLVIHIVYKENVLSKRCIESINNNKIKWLKEYINDKLSKKR